MKNKTPLTLDQKLELIKSKEKFIIDHSMFEDDKYFYFDEENDLSDDKGYNCSNAMSVFLRDDCYVYKYEEPEEEWVVCSDNNCKQSNIYYGMGDTFFNNKIRKSWIEEKAREFGMQYK